MNKMIVWGFLCMIVFVTVGCESLSQCRHSKPAEPAAAPDATAGVAAAEEGALTPKSSGYLSEGATVKIDTGEGRSKVSLLEQFEQTRRACALLQEKTNALEKALASEKAKGSALESELEALKEQQGTIRQITMENEELRKQLENVQAPYEKKILDLAMELTRAQIEETKAKQELLSIKIETLMEKKKQKSQDE